METAPREVMAELSLGGAAAAVAHAATAARAAPARFAPIYAPVETPTFIRLDSPGRVRLSLQQRAVTNLRRHLLRAVRRFVVLVVADLTSFFLIRELVRAFRDRGVLGDAVTAQIHEVLPSGILSGWQYAAALFIALFLTGNYGFADQRRDARRLFIACALATALPLWMTIWMRGLEPVLVQFGLVTGLVWVGLLLERRTINLVVMRVRPAERDRMDVLFVGPGADCIDAMRAPAFSASMEYRAIGF